MYPHRVMNLGQTQSNVHHFQSNTTSSQAALSPIQIQVQVQV
jgi:hypothetical protein